MAEPITQARLRALAAVHPEQGRVLSVFLNLDPTEFATPSARSSAITSVLTAATHKVESKDGLTHEERMALRDDVERVRDVLVSDVAANGTRAIAVYACGPADLLEIVRLRRPVENKVVLDRTAFVEPLVLHGTDEEWLVLVTNRRAARLFVGPGDALRGDRPDRRRRALQARQGRLVAGQLPALGRQGGHRPPPARRRARLRRLQEARAGPRADRRAGRAADRVQEQAAPVPEGADRRPDLDRHRERVARRRLRGGQAADRGAHPQVRARGAGPPRPGRRRRRARRGRASTRCSTRSTRRAWRRC